MAGLRDAYEAHGITHVSASSLNGYAAEPAHWVLSRLLKRPTPIGAAAHRGTAAEKGVTWGLLTPSMPLENCQTLALQHFDRLVAALLADATEEERDKIVEERRCVPGIVAVALAELRQYGVPDEVQARVDHELDRDLPPLEGYSDFGWSEHGIVVDLKTQLRLGADISAPHARQLAAYLHSTDREGRICYCTPKRCGVYVLENAEVRFAELREIAIRLGRFLSLSKDPMELAALLVPDVDDFRWSGKAAQDARMEVYGL